MLWVVGTLRLCIIVTTLSVLGVPTALAAEAHGDVLVSSFSLPADAQAGGELKVAMLNHMKHPLPLSHFRIEAASMRVHEYEAPHLDAQVTQLRTETRQRSYNLTNVAITLGGETQLGYVAAVADHGSTWTISGSQPLSFESREETTLTSDRATAASASRPSDRFFVQHLRGAHVLAEGAGSVVLEGSGVLKIFGLPLILTSDENVSYFKTGRFQESPLAQVEYRWVYIEATEFRIETVSPLEWLIASGQGSAQWNASFALDSLGGSLWTDEGRIDVRPGTGAISGSFSSSFVPLVVHGQCAIQMALLGDFDSTTYPYGERTSAPRAPPLAGSDAFTSLMVALTVAGGGALLALHRIRAPRAGRQDGAAAVHPSAPPPPAIDAASLHDLTPELCVSLAETQVQMECWPRALHWITLARQMCPTSASIRATEAFVLGEMGQTEEALAAYEEASRLDPEEGEHDLNAARLALRRGQPVDVVEAFVLRALARTPGLVAEVEPDDALTEALGVRPAFRAAVVEAWSYQSLGA